MKNVYDILLNFKNEPYEFYEWDSSDEIDHVRKIPSFKVDDLTLYEFLNYNVCVSNEFLKEIYEKTEVFKNHLIKKIPYACILFNNEISLAVLFDENANVKAKSKLLFDEENDVISSAKALDLYKIEYFITKKIKNDKKLTRKEKITIYLLNKYIDKTYENKCFDELKYIYLECFNKKQDDVVKAFEKIKESINKMDFKILCKLKGLIKVLKK